MALTLKVEPASCQCGGTHAWLRQRESGAWEMIGCVCHTDLAPLFQEAGIPVPYRTGALTPGRTVVGGPRALETDVPRW